MLVITVQSFSLQPATVSCCNFFGMQYYTKESNKQLDINETFIAIDYSLLHYPVESDAPAISSLLHQPRAKSKFSILHHAPPLLTICIVVVQVSPRDLSASAGGHLQTNQLAIAISVGSHCHHSLILLQLESLLH